MNIGRINSTVSFGQIAKATANNLKSNPYYDNDAVKEAIIDSMSNTTHDIWYASTETKDTFEVVARNTKRCVYRTDSLQDAVKEANKLHDKYIEDCLDKLDDIDVDTLIQAHTYKCLV